MAIALDERWTVRILDQPGQTRLPTHALTPLSMPCPSGNRTSAAECALIHAADPEVGETIKRTSQPYFVLQGNICALLAAKDHVNTFLYDPLVRDPEGIITSGHENKTGRTVAIQQGEAINEEALLAMFRAIIAHNRAGGWRKIGRETIG